MSNFSQCFIACPQPATISTYTPSRIIPTVVHFSQDSDLHSLDVLTPQCQRICLILWFLHVMCSKYTGKLLFLRGLLHPSSALGSDLAMSTLLGKAASYSEVQFTYF